MLVLIGESWTAHFWGGVLILGTYQGTKGSHYIDQSLCLVGGGCTFSRKEMSLELTRSGLFRWAWWRPGTTWCLSIIPCLQRTIFCIIIFRVRWNYCEKETWCSNWGLCSLKPATMVGQRASFGPCSASIARLGKVGNKGHLKDEVRAGDRLSEGELVLPAQWVEQWVGPPLQDSYMYLLYLYPSDGWYAWDTFDSCTKERVNLRSLEKRRAPPSRGRVPLATRCSAASLSRIASTGRPLM